MKTQDTLLYGALGVVVLVLIFSVVSMSGISLSTKKSSQKDSPSAPQPKDALKTVSTGSTDQGDIRIDLTPHKVTNGEMVVDIAANTHSVDMSPYDFTKRTILKYDGKSIYPKSVPSMSGHHNSGKLVFEVDEEPASFTITITGIPAVETRTFAWP